jgi:hypothetical protein
VLRRKCKFSCHLTSHSWTLSGNLARWENSEIWNYEKFSATPFFIFNSFFGYSQVQSSLVIYDLETKTRTIVFIEESHLEAPNWSEDGNHLIINSQGKLLKINITTKVKSEINISFANMINNDHGISPMDLI